MADLFPPDLSSPDPRPALAAELEALAPAAADAGVTIAERLPAGMASVLARKGRAPALAERVRERFALALPAGPVAAAAGRITFLGTGPGAWLAIDGDDGRWAATLRQALPGLASVCDQSSSYAVLRLTGPKVRDLLAKGVFVDLDPAVLPEGGVIVTAIAHVGVTLWQVDGQTFDLAVFRSYAGSLWHWLCASGAEYGLGRAGLRG